MQDDSPESTSATGIGLLGFNDALTVTHASGDALRHVAAGEACTPGMALDAALAPWVLADARQAFVDACSGRVATLTVPAPTGGSVAIEIRPNGMDGTRGGHAFVIASPETEGEPHTADDADRLRLLVENVHDYAILTLDVDGHVASWNPGAQRFKGWTAEEIIGQHFSSFYPAEDVARRKPWWALEVAATTGRFEDEGWRVRNDGTRFWASVVILALRDESGELRGFGKVTRDLTERRERELRLLESEARMTAILDAATEYSIIATDADGLITTFNSGAERMLGYAAGEVVGIETPAIIHEAGEVVQRAAELGIEPGFEVFVHAARLGLPETREWTYIAKDGTRIPVSLTVTATAAASGTTTGFIGIARDLTQQRQDERLLREAMAEFETTFVNAPFGLALGSVSRDRPGRYLSINDAFLEIVGYERGVLIDLDVTAIVHPDDVAEMEFTMDQLLRGEITRSVGEFRFIRSTNQYIEVEVALTVSFDDDRRPKHLIIQVQDITSRKRYERQLIHLAAHDPLTGLVNKPRLIEALASEIARVRRSDASAAVLMIDLDGFKTVNDLHGHAAGDELLINVARILQSRLRESDVIARIGGDEFAVLLNGTDQPSAERVAMELCDRIREHFATEGAPDSRRVTVSIGIAMVGPDTDCGAEEVLAEADAAMYAGKHGGGDRIALRPDAATDRPTRTTIRSQIERALDEPGGFELFAQPIVALDESPRRRFELLLRMMDETGKPVSPAVFLESAERSRHIHAIDHWVVRETIDLLARCAERGLDICVEANLSGRSLGDASLAALIEERLTATGVDGTRLTFEVTETAAVENMGAARNFAQRLRGLGCTFALDDFGSGYGSFYYLKHLPFDYLKIDGEFVKNATTNVTDQLVIKACVDLARGLGKQTVAEFVETDECLALLRRLGVDHAQGFAIGHPAPLTAFGLPSIAAPSGIAAC